jgi:acetyltransferase-like isoleucine patch superfamily enzyme
MNTQTPPITPGSDLALMPAGEPYLASDPRLAALRVAARRTVRLYNSTREDERGRRGGRELAFPITIGHNVWVSGGAIICPGVTIGDDAVIGAGSVVTRSVAAGTTVAGNPGRAIRQA